jgi:hypothetical protein
LSGYSNPLINKAFEEIRTEPKEQILNVNESQYIEHILAKFRLEVPEIFESQKTVDSVERTVEVERVTLGYEPSAGMRVRRHFSVFEIPFSGDGELFNVRPSSGVMWVSMQPVEIGSNRLIVEYPTPNTTPERIKRGIE